MKEVEVLLQALPYMRQHKGATIVVKCGGEIARDEIAWLGYEWTGPDLGLSEGSSGHNSSSHAPTTRSTE